MRQTRRSSFAPPAQTPHEEASLQESLGSHLSRPTESTKNSPKHSQAPSAPVSFQVGFPPDRLQLYRDIFAQLSHLKCLINTLIGSFPRTDDHRVTTASILLEKQVLFELKNELAQPALYLEHSQFYQHLANGHSVKPLLDQFGGGHLLPACPAPQPEEPKRAFQSPTAQIIPHPQSKEAQGPPMKSQPPAVKPFVRDSVQSMKSSGAGNNIDAAPPAICTANSTRSSVEPAGNKDEVKRLLTLVLKLFSENKINESQRSVLKRAVFSNSRKVFEYFASFEKNGKLELLLEYVDEMLRGGSVRSPGLVNSVKASPKNVAQA